MRMGTRDERLMRGCCAPVHMHCAFAPDRCQRQDRRVAAIPQRLERHKGACALVPGVPRCARGARAAGVRRACSRARPARRIRIARARGRPMAPRANIDTTPSAATIVCRVAVAGDDLRAARTRVPLSCPSAFASSGKLVAGRRVALDTDPRVKSVQRPLERLRLLDVGKVRGARDHNELGAG